MLHNPEFLKNFKKTTVFRIFQGLIHGFSICYFQLKIGLENYLYRLLYPISTLAGEV